MKAIIGLGNPGDKYENTRHNLGFLALDQLRAAFDFPPFKLNKKFEAEISKGQLNQEKIILAKPQTFMNESGRAVQKIARFFNLAPEDIWVVQDDKDLPLGKIRFRQDGSSGGHNGIQSIIATIGPDFARFKIGIAPKSQTQNAKAEDLSASQPEKSAIQPPTIHDTSDFVLGRISKPESKVLKTSIAETIDTIKSKLSQ